MKNPACLLLAALFTLTGHAGTPDWSVRISPFNQIFPGLELSQSSRWQNATSVQNVFGRGNGLTSITVHAQQPGEKLLLDIAVPGLGLHQTFSAELPNTGIEYRLHPPLAWNALALLGVKHPMHARMTFSLRRNRGVAAIRRLDIRIHPLNEALYFVREGNESVDLSWVFAGYVDERSSVVTRILDAAKTIDISRHFDGYAEPVQGVYRQVWAVWQVLAEHGIHYSSADPAIEHGPYLFTQRVRSLDDIWAGDKANCIDGSVLIASVLQRIGLRSFLVLVPGHAFVGFYTDADSRHAAYLETTVLGADIVHPFRAPAFAADMISTPAHRRSLAGFLAALAAGRAGYQRAAVRLDGRHRPDYAIIDITAARSRGIVPIAEAINHHYRSP